MIKPETRIVHFKPDPERDSGCGLKHPKEYSVNPWEITCKHCKRSYMWEGAMGGELLKTALRKTQ